MVNEEACNCMAITSLLYEHFPNIAEAIEDSCRRQDVTFKIIRGSRDYWCRDFMPLQVNTHELIQFTYNPSYYQGIKYQHLQTDPQQIDYTFTSSIIYSDIIMEGGNLVYFDNKAIITRKVCKDNANYAQAELSDKIICLLQLHDLMIIPTIPFDITGHADGMVKFISEEVLLVNDFSKIAGKKFDSSLKKILKNLEVLLLPNDLHLNRNYDDTTGDYINFVIIKNEILVPMYGSTTDDMAVKKLYSLFPGKMLYQVDCSQLAKEGGLLHCATWEIYSPPVLK